MDPFFFPQQYDYDARVEFFWGLFSRPTPSPMKSPENPTNCFPAPFIKLTIWFSGSENLFLAVKCAASFSQIPLA